MAHMSVKEYLSSPSARKFYGYDINEKISHSLIAQTCLAYLLQFDTVNLFNENTFKNFPLAPYAAKYWISHAKSAADGGTGTLQTLIDTLFLTDSDGPFISWIRLYDLDYPWKDADMERSPDGSRLYYASLAGFQEASLALLKGGANPYTKGGRYGSVLHAAASRGLKQVVQLLLDQGANVNLQGGHYGSALQAAASWDRKQIVRLLLEQGADVNLQDEEGESALQVAASRGDEQIVRLLLEQGANVNLQGGRHGSAFQAAAYHGDEQIVRLLLEQGADANLQGGAYGSSLRAVASCGDEQIVRGREPARWTVR